MLESTFRLSALEERRLNHFDMGSMPHLTTAIGLIIALTSVKFLSIPLLQQVLTFSHSSGHNQNNLCPLAPSVQSPLDGLLPSHRFIRDQSIRTRQADRLSKAVKIPTIIEEHMQDPYSDDFSPFLDFHGLLKSFFPLMYVHSLPQPLSPPHLTNNCLKVLQC